MNHVITPGQRSGSVMALASKSQAHRQVICAALSKKPSVIDCEGMSKDIEATINCMKALGAEINAESGQIYVTPVFEQKYPHSNISVIDDVNKTTELIPTDEKTERFRISGDIDEKPVAGNGKTESILDLYCGESGSTLRFLLPVAGALGANVVFHMEGRLPERPLGPFKDELTAHGMEIRKEGDLLFAKGQLEGGEFTLPGNISSQYISGLLMALPLLKDSSTINITGTIESQNYITMTEDVLKDAGIVIRKNYPEGAEETANHENTNETKSEGDSNDPLDTNINTVDVKAVYEIPGNQMFRFPQTAQTERDWSNATFFLCMGALSETGITVEGLNLSSSQGDRAVLEILSRFGAEIEISKDFGLEADKSSAQTSETLNKGEGALTPETLNKREAVQPPKPLNLGEGSQPPISTGSSIFVKRHELKGIVIDASRIPDMVPALSAVASVAKGQTRITHAERLRIKESDRLKSVTEMLAALGADIRETEDGLIINGKPFLDGGTVDAAGDHRIAMAAAVAASVCEKEVTVCGSECVSKSYPGFWEDYEKLLVTPLICSK